MIDYVAEAMERMQQALGKPDLNQADADIASLFGRIRQTLGAPPGGVPAPRTGTPKAVLDHLISGGFKKAKGIGALAPLLLLALLSRKE